MKSKLTEHLSQQSRHFEEVFEQRYERWREIAYDSIGDDDYEPEEDYDD